MDVLLSTSGIVIIVVMILLTFVMWKVAKLLLIPIQILLFLALMFIAYRLLFTPERLDKLSGNPPAEKSQTPVDSGAGKKIADKIKQEAIQAGKAALDSVKSAAAQQGNAPAAPGKAQPVPPVEGEK